MCRVFWRNEPWVLVRLQSGVLQSFPWRWTNSRPTSFSWAGCPSLTTRLAGPGSIPAPSEQWRQVRIATSVIIRLVINYVVAVIWGNPFSRHQGRTGSTAVHRSGFQRLVTEVGLGKVGIVLMLEASRLARNNSDWYRLIDPRRLHRSGSLASLGLEPVPADGIDARCFHDAR